MNNQGLTSGNSLFHGQNKAGLNNGISPKFDFETHISPFEIIDEANGLIKTIEESEENKGLFKVKSANLWIDQAKARPIPKMLFNEFWFEGELCILFADTNLGKSILAVQIGDSISKGILIPGFKMEAERQRVLYCDFELSDKQFENRYSSDFKDHYRFDENLLRVEINPDSEIPNGLTFEDFLYQSLERSIIESNSKILIIDNITFLKSETEKAKDALPLMKQLKSLKNKYGLSILALAHTPKRDLSKPITRNDLQGSKMLINFCDSSFTIGESSHEKSTRYLKQIKSRNTELIYDSDNVIVCNIDKPDNYLKFNYLNFGTEKEHLKQVSEKDKSELVKKIEEIIQEDSGITPYGIAKKLCEDESKFQSFKVKVSRIVKKLSNSSNN